MILELTWFGKKTKADTYKQSRLYAYNAKGDKFVDMSFRHYSMVATRLRLTLFYYDVEIGYSTRFVK